MAAAFVLCVLMGNEAVTTLAENRPVQRQVCIVIDPGHGGEDGGAVSCSGIPESSYNLEISQRLNALLNLLGYHTEMIRTSDISVYKKGETLAQKKASDLKERVNRINVLDQAVLLSIHQNHYPDERYSGAQVFYANTEGSSELAQHLQAAFVSTLNPGSHRQAKKASGIYIMEHIRCPGVLIECGFLSNHAEEAKLRNPDYQKKLCCVIASATCQYLSNT
jgi:N-acetylmuramoyl-L-alanine amidase